MLNYQSVVRDLRMHARQLQKAADVLSGTEKAFVTKHVEKIEKKAHTMSKAARKRISIAQKRRWAKARRQGNVVSMRRAS